MMLNPRESGKFIATYADHVKINSKKVSETSEKIVELMESKPGEISVNRWKTHELLPQSKNNRSINWVFFSDVINFSFWTKSDEKFEIKFNKKKWTGYWSLCAAFCRAEKEGFQITDAKFMEKITEDTLKHIFRSDSLNEMPMIKERKECLHQASSILNQKFGGNFSNVIKQSDRKSLKLLDLIVENFPSFRDESTYKGKRVAIYKRAQILIGDLWALMEGEGICQFEDLHLITAFADYRVPQALNWLGVLEYSPQLKTFLYQDHLFFNGDLMEVEIRGVTIQAVQLLVEEINILLKKKSSLIGVKVNAIMIDTYLWDMRREQDHLMTNIPFHKIRCIFY